LDLANFTGQISIASVFFAENKAEVFGKIWLSKFTLGMTFCVP